MAAMVNRALPTVASNGTSRAAPVELSARRLSIGDARSWDVRLTIHATPAKPAIPTEHI